MLPMNNVDPNNFCPFHDKHDYTTVTTLRPAAKAVNEFIFGNHINNVDTVKRLALIWRQCLTRRTNTIKIDG